MREVCGKELRNGRFCGLIQEHAMPHRSAESMARASAWQAGPGREKTNANSRKRNRSRRTRRERVLAEHAGRVKREYGISGEEYWAIYEFQGRRCAICRIATGRKRKLSVDHWHGCKEGHTEERGCRKCVRGLLCSNCNSYLGYRARDKPDAYQRGIDYLADPPAQRWLRRNAND